MTGPKFRWPLLPVMLASAIVGFAQTSPLEMSSGPSLSPGATNLANRPDPVGPGMVNYVEGQVFVGGQEITPQSIGTIRLNPGQVLETGAGYAEVLLTPGAFLRIGQHSEVRMGSAGLANTTAELVHGSSILEVDQLIKGTHVAVRMDGATTQIEKKGLYDFDAAQPTVKVLEGRAKVQEAGGAQTLSKNKELLLAGSTPLKRRSFDEKNVKLEPLYVWSRVRSEEEAQASINAANNAGAYQTADAGWYWDPSLDCYGFWPAAGVLDSPFGWEFYSPAYLGYGYAGYYGVPYYGGVYYGGRRFGYHRFDHDGDGHANWTSRQRWAGGAPRSGSLHGRLGGVNARVGGFRAGFAHGPGMGFRGGMGAGFHGGGFHSGGFHGGGARR